MQGGIARTFLLFHGRGQLMIDHGPISDFNLQRLMHRRKSFGRFLQFPFNGLIFVGSNLFGGFPY
jgi:hypothetical protein